MTSMEEEINALKNSVSKGDLSEDAFLNGFSVASAFNNLGFILASVLNEAQNGSSESLYRYLLDFCGPDDTFITLNWDTLLDRALVDSGGWSPNVGYGLRFSAALDGTWKPVVDGNPHFATNWRLLKLHGSTNWLVPLLHVHFQTFEYVSSVPKSDRVFLYWQSSLPYGTHKGRWRGGYVPTTYCYYPPNIPTAYFQEPELSPEPGEVFVSFAPKGVFSAFDEPDCDGVPSSALLITPVRQKRYDIYQAAMDSLWNQSAEALATADRIVIIGYSFPPTDTRSLELLGNALIARPNTIAVEVVAPNASDTILRLRDTRLGNAKSVRAHDIKFEDYFDILAGRVPFMMKTAIDNYIEVREWVERIYALGQITLARQQGEIELK
jgi:hypothetical protein